MKSSIQEYDAEFKQLEEAAMAEEEGLSLVAYCNGQAKAWRARQQELDPADSAAVKLAMEAKIEKGIEDEAYQAFRATKQAATDIREAGTPLSMTLQRIKQYVPSDLTAVIIEEPLDASVELDIAAAKNPSPFSMLFQVNNVLALVCRLEFLAGPISSSKLRIVLACLVWLVIGSVFSVMPWVLLGALVNIGVYVALRSAAKEALRTHRAIWLAVTNRGQFVRKLFAAKMGRFRAEVVAGWEAQLARVQAGTEDGADILAGDLHRAICESLEKSAKVCEHEAEKYAKEGEEQAALAKAATVKRKEIAARLTELESQVRTMTLDPSHNDGVLSPFVAVGFDRRASHGASELVAIKHDGKPVLIGYERETMKNGERFRKNIARMVELLMNSFLQENNYDIVNLWFVDLEAGGAHFPESRTKGFMNVVRTQQELKGLYEQLREARETASKLGNGRIASINPERLANREKPLKYNIVFFSGVDLESMNKEDSQIFVGGSTFGFIPIMFMDEEAVESMGEENASSKPFAPVVGKAIDNGLHLSLEEIVDRFEYGLAVSDNPEGVYGQRVMSYQEFMEGVESDDGINVPGDGSVCFDVVGATPEFYEVWREALGRRGDLVSSTGQVPDLLEDEIVVDLTK